MQKNRRSKCSDQFLVCLLHVEGVIDATLTDDNITMPADDSVTFAHPRVSLRLQTEDHEKTKSSMRTILNMPCVHCEGGKFNVRLAGDSPVFFGTGCLYLRRNERICQKCRNRPV